MKQSASELEVRVHDTLIRDIKHHRAWFTALGITFLLLGMAAIVFPWVATLSIDLAVGALMLVAGIAQLLHSFSVPRWRGTVLSICLSGFAIIAGTLMVFFPLAGIITLTILVMLFFLLSGIFKTIFAFQVRPAIGWGWILVSGLMSVGLGLLILIKFNEALPWVLGVLLGIDFIVTSVWMLALATSAKKIYE